jgi:hypothetical protein
MIHNHGTEEGEGLACPELRLPDGSRKGVCVINELFDQAMVSARETYSCGGPGTCRLCTAESFLVELGYEINSARKEGEMAFTSHGHQIPGTTEGKKGLIDPIPCGGVTICTRCKSEVQTTIALTRVEEKNYPATAIGLVTGYIEKQFHPDVDHPAYTVYVVSFSKTLNNWTALVRSTLPDGILYEVIYDGERRETTINPYLQIKNQCVTIPD